MNELVCRQLKGLAGNVGLPLELGLRLLEHGDHGVRFRLLWHASVSDEMFAAAVSHPDSKVRAIIADNWYAPAVWRARLADDVEAEVRRRVAVGPRPFRRRVQPLPAEVYARLASDPDATVRAEAAGHRDTPADVRVGLAADPDPIVRMTTCRSWLELPDAAVDSLLDDKNPRVRRAAMQRAYGRRPEFVAQLLEDDSWDSVTIFHRNDVAQSVLLDRTTAEMLTTHNDRDLRQAVAANPTLPPDLVARLGVDESSHVRLVVSMRRDLTEDQRADVDYEVKPHDRLTPPQWVLDNLHDLELMGSCVHSRHLGLRRSAAYSPHLTSDLVAMLAGDNDFAVRLLLCENHPDAPADLLLKTFLEAKVITRFDLLDRPNFPRSQLARLADSPDPDQRRLAILDPKTTSHTIEQFSHDPEQHVRAGAAADARLNIDRIMQLLTEADTAAAAAANPRLPLDAMTKILTEGGIAACPEN